MHAVTYSLGTVLYEMLTGDRPHTAPDIVSLIARLQTEPALPARSLRPDVSPAINRAIEQALAKLPEARFSSMAAFARALTDHGSGESAKAADPEPERPSLSDRLTAVWRALVKARS
jgi:serine/threonine-protein kinase